jgi:hypothetical protein
LDEVVGVSTVVDELRGRLVLNARSVLLDDSRLRAIRCFAIDVQVVVCVIGSIGVVGDVKASVSKGWVAPG